MKQFFVPLTEPLGAIWLLMLAGVAWQIFRKQWRGAAWLGLPTLMIFLFASTPLAKTLVTNAESRYGSQPAVLDPAPASCAVLVLGGGHAISRADPLGFSVSSAGDRYLAGLELLRTGKADTLILGGHWPRPGQTESGMAAVQRWMASLQVRPGIMFTNLGICRDTHDEVLALKSMNAGGRWGKVFLVTSALHMRRSEAAFRRAGVDVVPVACDFQAYGVEDLTPWSLFPRQQRLELLSLYLHEQIGWVIYRLRGWV